MSANRGVHVCRMQFQNTSGKHLILVVMFLFRSSRIANKIIAFQNVKAVFDSAIGVVLQPPKLRKVKKKSRNCAIL